MNYLELEFEVDGKDYVSCGHASDIVKRTLRQMDIPPQVIRKVAIAMYEGEVNMFIHAGGGKAKVHIYPEKLEIWLSDNGPGIENIDNALKEGFSTASAEARSMGFGAGMGLPNMKKYSDGMAITSEVGKGTTVYLRINFT